MAETLFATWRAAKGAGAGEAALKPVLNSIVESGSDEVEKTLRKLRETDREGAVELLNLARAVAGRSDLEKDGLHVQAQLLLMPVLVTVPETQRAGLCRVPDIPPELCLEDLLARTLGLELGSLRAAPFMVSAASMAHLPLPAVRDLGMHLAVMGDHVSLIPALLEPEPDQAGRHALFLPMIWTGGAQDDLPGVIAEQRLRSAYMEAKVRVEDALERQLSTACGLQISVTAFKPLSYAMAFGFLKRVLFFLDVKAANARLEGGLAGSKLNWRLSKDHLSLTFEFEGGGELELQSSFPEEPLEQLELMLAQLATSIAKK